MKNIIKTLNSDRTKKRLFAGDKVRIGEMVYWANMVTMEIYGHSIDDEISRRINGHRIAGISDNWEIIS